MDLKWQELSNTAYFIDTHCHLNLPEFQSDWQTVVKNAADVNVKQIIVPGIDLPTSEIARKMADENSVIFFAVGIHPNTSIDWDETIVSRLETLADHPKCVAIGEIGLDFYRDTCPVEKQIQSFQAQLTLAERLQKPVLIHCRKAFHSLWPILFAWKSANPDNQGVLHAFDEDGDAALEVTQAGFYIGIGGAYTYKKNDRRIEILQRAPLDRMLLETDAPYLTPLPHRGERNTPAYIPLIAEKISTVRDVSLAELCQKIMENSRRLFSIP